MIAMERAGIAALSQCRVGECGFCRSVVASGRCTADAAHDSRSAEDAARGVIHPCCTYPESDMEIFAPEDPRRKSYENFVCVLQQRMPQPLRGVRIPQARGAKPVLSGAGIEVSSSAVFNKSGAFSRKRSSVWRGKASRKRKSSLSGRPSSGRRRRSSAKRTSSSACRRCTVCSLRANTERSS